MATLSLSAEISVLPCPACGQTINTSMATCPFCGVPIDHAAAVSAAAFSKLNQAISDASYIRIAAGASLGFYFLQFVPFFAIIGLGFLVMEFVLPFLMIRWWSRYGAIASPDPELRAARRKVIWVAVATVLFILLVNVAPRLLRH